MHDARTFLPSPLLLLIAMRYRARWRRFVRSLKTVRGIAVAIGGACLAALVLLPMVLRSLDQDSSVTPSPLVEGGAGLGPLFVMGYFLFTMVGNAREQAFVFHQAEVDLLFPAPFTRRQLLVYSLTQRAILLVLVAVVLSLFVRAFTPSWVVTMIGLWLILNAVTLASIGAALVGLILGERRQRRWTRTTFLAFVAVVAAGAWWSGVDLTESPLQALKAFAASWPARIITAPVVPFVETIAAPAIDLAFLGWAAAALAINAVLFVIVLRLDADWTEASIESSRRMAQRMERFRSSGGAMPRAPGLASVRVPMPPRLGGLGPLAWRQAVGVVRNFTSLLMMLVIIAVICVILVFMGRRSAGTWSFPTFAGIGVGYMSLFLLQTLRYDFRGDIDRMDVLKALPVSPFVVAFAQIIVPATLITVIQCIAVVVLMLTTELPVPAAPLIPFALFLANVVIVGLENAAFLYKPYRWSAAPGMNYAGSQFVVMFAKMMVAGLLAALVAVPAVLVHSLFGADLSVVIATAAGVLAVEALVVVLAVRRLFVTFDPARDIVPDA